MKPADGARELVARTPSSHPPLTRAERVRAFYWFRNMARDEATTAVKATELGFSAEPFLLRMVAHLSACVELFPLDHDKDAITVEEIVQGREPTA